MWSTLNLYCVSLSQFNRYDLEDGCISERDFASLLLTYAGFPDKKKALMIRRVKKAYKDDEKAKVGLVNHGWLLFQIYFH